MTNSTKIMLTLGLLSILGACGDDGDEKVKDAGGPIITPIADTGVPVIPVVDSGAPVTPTNDGGTPVTPPADSGMPVTPGDCFNGVPVKMEDFLNRCTTAATATKTLAVPPALLNADGTVKPL
jgi:hypothetical protein